MSCGPLATPIDAQSGSLYGNYAAVGFFEPEIQIWNLNVTDTLEPVSLSFAQTFLFFNWVTYCLNSWNLNPFAISKVTIGHP